MKLAVYDPASASSKASPATADSDADTTANDAPSALTASELTTELADRGIDLADASAADLLVTVGVAGLRAAVAGDDERPLLPIGFAESWQPEPTEFDALAERLSSFATKSVSSVSTTPHRPLQLSVGETTATAVCDCALITSQPARISEYAVAAAAKPAAETDATTTTEFRSDGVVVATPLGSEGYARAAGGPRLAPETGVAVVPIAPFAMQADSLVCHPPLSLTVERDTDVTVFADDQRVATGGDELSVSISLGSAVSVVDARGGVDRQ